MSDRPTTDRENDVPPEEALLENEPSGQAAAEQSELPELGVPAAAFADADDRLLRVQAELENFRKRSRREMEEQRRYAALPLISDLLGVLDNLQRAIEACPAEESNNGLLEGVKMVAAQLVDVLERHHCRRIESVGEPFDPHLHEALGQQPSDQYEANAVMQEVQGGYQLHDRVIRPARVFISSGPGQAEKPAEE